MITLFLLSLAGIGFSYLVYSATINSWKVDLRPILIAAAIFLFGSWVFESFDSKITRILFVVLAALSHHAVKFVIRKRQ